MRKGKHPNLKMDIMRMASFFDPVTFISTENHNIHFAQVNTMAADTLAPCGARASAAMVLTCVYVCNWTKSAEPYWIAGVHWGWGLVGGRRAGFALHDVLAKLLDNSASLWRWKNNQVRNALTHWSLRVAAVIMNESFSELVISNSYHG